MRGVNLIRKKFQAETGVNIDDEIERAIGFLEDETGDSYTIKDYIEWLEELAIRNITH